MAIVAAMEMGMGMAMEKGSDSEVPVRVSHPQLGTTLAELTVSMALTSLLAAGFMFAFEGMNRNLQRETSLGSYQDTVRLALYQFSRDVRLAGANPTGNIELFDGQPSADVALDIDPDKDGNLTNGILIHYDKSGTSDNEPDGDASDSQETVLYSYDAAKKRIDRNVWRVVRQSNGTTQSGYDPSPFLENVCTFKLTYLDYTNKTTTTAELASTVLLEVTTAAGPRQCNQTKSFTRYAYARTRLRNR